MTVETLRAALDDLEVHAGVPHDARLKVSHYANAGWEIVAIWTPDSKPAEAPSGPVLEEDPLVSAERIQRDTRTFRRIRDNPQA